MSDRAPVRRALERRQSRRGAARGELEELVELLDDDPVRFTVEQWQHRNLRLFDELARRALIDPVAVPPEAHRFLTERLIRPDHPAATDPQNAGHVRAQNENILHYGLSLGVPRRVLGLSLEAGFVHDLNKAIGEPLRRDRYGVRNAHGELVDRMETLAQSVGLNHLGERTRAVLNEALHLPRGALPAESVEAIDLCIVHHGLGSSRFIRLLLEGENAWWGSEFVDPKTGVRKLIHPPMPPLTLLSVLHDLADSTQQMQAGVAWLEKYPAGFWRGSGRSFHALFSGRSDGTPAEAGIPMSLRQQIDVEQETCRGIVADARSAGLVDRTQGAALNTAITAAAKGSLLWIEDDPAYLAHPRGLSVYHDVGRALGVPAEVAQERLAAIQPPQEGSGAFTPAGGVGATGSDLERLVWASARELDLRRTRELARRIVRAASPD